MFVIIDLEGFIRTKESVINQEKIKTFEVNDPGKEIIRAELLEELLMVEGKDLKTPEDWLAIEELAADKKAIIFLSLPEAQIIEALELEELLGILKLKEEKTQDELQFVSGFLLGGPYHLKKITYPALDLDLSDRKSVV